MIFNLKYKCASPGFDLHNEHFFHLYIYKKEYSREYDEVDRSINRLGTQSIQLKTQINEKNKDLVRIT